MLPLRRRSSHATGCGAWAAAGAWPGGSSGCRKARCAAVDAGSCAWLTNTPMAAHMCCCSKATHQYGVAVCLATDTLLAHTNLCCRHMLCSDFGNLTYDLKHEAANGDGLPSIHPNVGCRRWGLPQAAAPHPAFDTCEGVDSGQAWFGRWMTCTQYYISVLCPTRHSMCSCMCANARTSFDASVVVDRWQHSVILDHA